MTVRWTRAHTGRMEGTRSADVFNLTLDENQWTRINGGAGDDTLNIHAGGRYLQLDYRYPRTLNGVDVDLEAGRANDDGFGDVDTIRGEVWEVRGTYLSDVIRGSDNDETFIGYAGEDVIDGRGGYDRLRFDRFGVRNVSVDLQAGTATGTWGDAPFTYTIDHLNSPEERLVGTSFSYRISNIERVLGSNGDDVLRGSGRDERLEGRDGVDRLEGGAGDDRLYGGNDDDSDSFIFGPGHGEDRIYEFGNGEDVIVLIGLGVTKAQVLENAHAWSEGVGVWIDLRPFGGGTISISGLPRSDLDESDFLL